MFYQPMFYPEAMNSQDKITISGVVFHVEDACRSLLHNYLKSLARKRNQQLEEERIAELLLEELKEEGKQVVTKEEVEHLIQKTKHLQMPD
ncbi:hypothetical protein [Roseivirga sp.]|uniref:hypothetical protein n=1 Tax=Roseivirga sp. TaxID=1964215 RepID=UPI003B515DE0